MQTPQYSLIHQYDTARPNGEDAIVLTVLMLLFTEAVLPGSYTRGASRRCLGSVVRESYDGRVSVL